VDVVFEACEATSKAKRAALAALSNIEARGNTNLGLGWLTGATQIAGLTKLSRLMLLTDGLANEGICDIAELEKHAAELRKRNISTSTFGVGDRFNEELLQRIATAGGGNFYYIANAAQISDYMMSELGEALEIVATGVTLSITHDADLEVESLSVLASEHTAQGTRLFLGSLVADQELDIILRLKIEGGDHDRMYQVVCASTDGALSLDGSLLLRVVPAAQAEAETPDADVVRAVAALDIARAHQEAVALNRAGRYGDAQSVMSSTVAYYGSYARTDAALRSTLEGATLASADYGASMSEADLKNNYWNASNTARGRTFTGQARRAGKVKS
jgi:Ca-activated chloride channel family protein